MTFLPVVLFWILAILAVMTRGPMLLYMFFGSMAFGAFAVVPPGITGGLTFTATPIVSLLIIGRAFMTRGGPDFLITSALRFNRMALLFLFWMVAVLVTLFMPRLFAGQVQVVPLRGEVGVTSLLQPSTQNISQIIYLSIAILSAFAFARILRSRVDRQHAIKAMCFGSAIVVLTGLVDFATQYMPIEPLLTPFRTATYALATDVEVLGVKRVVGLMPEASAYGGLCLGLVSALIFFRRAIADARFRNVYTPLVIGLLLLCCWLSKSSGTYLGLAILVLVMGAEALLRAYSAGRSKQLYRQDLIGELAIVFGLFVLVVVIAIIRPEVMDPIYEVIDRMVLQKTESASYAERGMWRAVAMESVFSTGGLGVGLGGTRASSSLVAIFSSTGVLGGMLYFGFVLQTLLRRSTHMDWEGQFILAAFRFSFIPAFVVSLMVGGAIIMTPLQAFSFGIVTATCFSSANIAARRARRKRTRIMQPQAGEEEQQPTYLLTSRSN
jgi:hypothetical protein